MTIAEFKAWLEGYEASFVDGGRPDLSQWETVKEKLATVTEFSPFISYSPVFTIPCQTVPVPYIPYTTPTLAGSKGIYD